MGQVVKALDEWLETMRQPNGYAGPVSHWWQSCYPFAGPALDWRYEGLFEGYARLLERTGKVLYQSRIETAAGHVLQGQAAGGSYVNSKFEANPGTLGTPHEAAASKGLLIVSELLGRVDWRAVALRNLNNLVDVYFDPGGPGFNDSPRERGRVPNKLSTLCEAFLLAYRETQEARWAEFADVALKDVIRLQMAGGRLKGAIHQWGRGPRLLGDGRFFPYYNARCVPALVYGANILGRPEYRDAAAAIVDFLDRVRNEDGSWPQLLYRNGRRVEYPHWIAPVADILLAYRMLDRPLPQSSVDFLLAGQLASGGFATAEGFSLRYRRRQLMERADYRDVTPVVGWNDKVLRLLTLLLTPDDDIPISKMATECLAPVQVGGAAAWYHENQKKMAIIADSGHTLFLWDKSETWSIAEKEVMIR